ncbi:MAG: ATP-dependent helicase [Candidatus Eisenbacteria bacterium]
MIEIEEPLLAFREYPGPVLLLAGPGTGKTWQLAMRIKFLLEEGDVTPGEIAVITFTNEAARNMRERLARPDVNIPSESAPKIISTMHSLGNTIIGTTAQMFGLAEEYEVLYDDNARRVLLQDAATLAGYRRDRYKITDDCRRKGACKPVDGAEACEICRHYKGLLRTCDRVDYDDQILLACEALRADTNRLATWQAQTRYLLVDEYQDINQAQCELIQLLSAGNRDGLFAVGDDDQSIYSFRGGNPKYIRAFEDYFGEDSKIGRLAKSWRCPEHILKGARGVISTYYPDSFPKPEPTFSDDIEMNHKIVFYDVPSDDVEASIIARLATEKIKTRSVIVIIPNGNYLQPIKVALERKRLSFTYKRDIDPAGIVRFALFADWVERPDDNVTLRYLLDLVVQNNDAITEIVDVAGGNLTAKRLAASELLASLWTDVDETSTLYEVLLRRASRNDGEAVFQAVVKCLAEAAEVLTEKGGNRKALPGFLHSCGLLVAPGKNPNGLIEEIRELRAERRAAGVIDNRITNVSYSYSEVRHATLRRSQDPRAAAFESRHASQERPLARRDRPTPGRRSSFGPSVASGIS